VVSEWKVIPLQTEFITHSLHKVHKLREMNTCWGRLRLSAIFIFEIIRRNLIKFSNWVKIFTVGLL